ncbi:MAG: lamin tail domain-containing protein, partial [Bacteroidota bacterium]
ASFRFYYIDESPVQAGDIVINEIMADPAPTEDLPEIEYVELYNPTNKAINMTEWSYSDLSTSVLLPSTVLLPDSFLILCKASDVDLIRDYGSTLGLSIWPSLNNSTDRISLTNELGEIIDYVEYDDSWYDDELKRYGGWSLELIDPEVSCKGNGIWTASTNSRGGTPGSVNSVRTELSDDTPPTISEAFVLNSDSIIVQFSETLSEQLPQVVLEGGSVLSIDYTNWNFDEILVVVEPLAPRVIYNIVANTIVDCAGNINDQDSWQVVLPEPAEEGDIVISELLFNPSSTGVDFVEVYNSSPKHISLHNWTLDGEGSEKEIEISSLLKPNSYRVFTKQPSVVLDEYPYALEEAIFQQDIPLMSNSSGHVVLMNESQEVIDSVRYEEAWHFQYLASYDGVSLERINFFGPGYLSSNWASAASTENYATPGYENSQQSVDKTDGAVSVQPKVIVPDANGVDDFTTIGMSDDLAGSLVTITIYNIQGVPVKQVANNALVGATSSFNWDGTDKNGILVPLGHYIIMVESITNDAQTSRYREKVVVATGF